MSTRVPFDGTLYSVIVPVVVIRPTWLTPASTNQRAPRARRDCDRLAKGGGYGEFGDDTGGRDPADLAGVDLGEPNGPVRCDTVGRGTGRRDRVFMKTAARYYASDFVGCV